MNCSSIRNKLTCIIFLSTCSAVILGFGFAVFTKMHSSRKETVNYLEKQSIVIGNYCISELEKNDRKKINFQRMDTAFIRTEGFFNFKEIQASKSSYDITLLNSNIENAPDKTGNFHVHGGSATFMGQ